jgi:DNA-directed RNA polymerase alpha subunit
MSLSHEYQAALSFEAKRLLNAIDTEDFDEVRKAHEKLGYLIPAWQANKRNAFIAISGLSVRTLKVLEREGIVALSDLHEFSEEDMLRWPGFGRKSLNELREAGVIKCPVHSKPR